MPQQEVVVAALTKTAFMEHPPKSLVNFICKIQERDAFIYFIYNQLTQERVPVGNKDYTFNN